jgi:glyoxylase-like metal-dependent hydrolase (beta-lactamase superfamily II)
MTPMRMHLLSGGRIRVRKNLYYPSAERSETIELPVPCFLFRHPQGNVLFDSGCHPSVVSNAAARWGDLTRVMTPVMLESEHVISALAGLELKPDDIDAVICSHLHPDHCGCNAFFKRATVVLHAREIEAARSPSAKAQGYLAADWDHPMPIDEISGERDLFADGRIVLLPLPGHTPGTLGALVQLEHSGTFLLASDTVSMRENLDDGLVPRNTWNADVLVKSLAEINRIAARGVTVFYGHDDRQWRTLRKGAEAYD